MSSNIVTFCYLYLFLYPEPVDDGRFKASGWIIAVPFIASSILLFGGSICWIMACRVSTPARTNDWPSIMIWNRPRCRRERSDNSDSYDAVPGSEPWAPRTSRTLPEHQIGDREQVLSYYLRRQTFPTQPCRTPPPPSYQNVVQNLDSFPIPPDVKDEISNTQGTDPADEVDLPSYSNVMIEYPEARQECFNMQQLSPSHQSV